MTTSTIHHRPAPFIAAAAAVAAIAAGTVAVTLSHDNDQPAPAQHSQTTVQQDPPRADHFQPTTSGGHVMLGQ